MVIMYYCLRKDFYNNKIERKIDLIELTNGKIQRTTHRYIEENKIERLFMLKTISLGVVIIFIVNLILVKLSKIRNNSNHTEVYSNIGY